MRRAAYTTLGTLCRLGIAGALAVLMSASSGCAAGGGNSANWTDRGRVYYLDGAGGNGPIINWGRGVHRGLDHAGVALAFESFPWHTGLGVLVDQAASVTYKRAKAAELADRIVAYRAAYPQAPVHLIGFSAGTALVLYTLEALPETCCVDIAVLVASSVSADYDLTAALRRVKDHLYVFTSERDAVLSAFVPLLGTADRRSCGRRVAGLHGFLPPSSPERTGPHDYFKLIQIAWSERFSRLGNTGGHTGFVEPRFVEFVIAPMLRANPIAARASDPPGIALGRVAATRMPGREFPEGRLPRAAP